MRSRKKRIAAGQIPGSVKEKKMQDKEKYISLFGMKKTALYDLFREFDSIMERSGKIKFSALLKRKRKTTKKRGKA